MKATTQILLTFVLNALWQGTLIVAFAALGDLMLRRVSPGYRHNLWVIALLACLIIPALSCLPLVQTNATAPSTQAPLGPIPMVTSRIITPGVEDVSTSRLPDQPKVSESASLSRSLRVTQWLAFTIVGVYLLIVLWRTVALMRAWRRTKKIVAGAFECAFPDAVQVLIERCQAEAGVKSGRVLCSSHVAMPITVGVWDRIVILPRRFASEVSVELLTSALGHEFQHVARHDYLLNLIYEVLYLPLSFHPAAALVRRRIRHTRELCCDAAVTDASISAEVYARSLVKLVGSAPLLPLAPDTTIGMNESDILEVRIMALLKKSNLSARRRVLLLIAAALLLALPCVAAARLGLSFETTATGQETKERQSQKKDRAQIERAVVELESEARKVKETLALTPPTKKDERAVLEAKLTEIQRNLEEHRLFLEASQLRTQEAAEQRLKRLLEDYGKSQPTDEAKLKEYQQLLAQAKLKSPAELEEVRQTIEKLAAEQAAAQGDRKPRLLSHSEPRYTDDARARGVEGKVLLGFTIDHNGVPQSIQIKRSLDPSLDQAAIEAVRDWRFEPAMKNGQVVSMWVESEIVFSLSNGAQSQEEREVRARRAKEEYEKAQFEGQEVRVRLGDESKRRIERLAEEKRDAVLAGLAKISMDHAIQIANSKVPGKVTECSLVGEHWEGSGELAKPSLVLYHVVVLSDGVTLVKSHVLINAMDGSVVSVKKEEKREEEEMAGSAYASEGMSKGGRAINGGVLNGKATSLPAPVYPDIARAAHASGPVNVRIVIDQGGNVIEATAISGHPLLRGAAMAAAKEARFTPTRLSGEPVMVSGTLVYNFIAQ